MTSGAVFTMRLKDVFEDTGGTWDSSTGISVLTGGDIGLDHYPLFTDGKLRTGENAVPDYRPILNGKIFDHFMNREIGSESYGVWRLSVRRKMNEIMPIYNQLYESLSLTFDPLSTVKLVTNNTLESNQETHQDSTVDQTATDAATESQTSNSSNTANNAGAARTVNSNTPQVQLSGNEDYADGAVDSNSQSTSNGSGITTNSSNKSDNATNHSSEANNGSASDNTTGNTTINGYQGLASDLIVRWRESFINVDMMVITELEDCFMQIWDNGDAFTSSNYERFYL